MPPVDAATGAADVTEADVAAAAAAGADAGATSTDAAVEADVAGRFSITPPVPTARLLPTNANANVAAKKIAAATPVDLDRKLEEPVAPNRLPEAPEPNAAPISAPLPCCNKTRPMMVNAAST